MRMSTSLATALLSAFLTLIGGGCSGCGVNNSEDDCPRSFQGFMTWLTDKTP